MIHLTFLVFGCFLAAASYAQYHPYYHNNWQHIPYPINRPQYYYNDAHPYQAYPSYEGRTPAVSGGFSRSWNIFTTITLSLSTATVSSTVTTTTTCTTSAAALTVCSPSGSRRRRDSVASQLFYKEDDESISLQMDEAPKITIKPVEPKPKEQIKSIPIIIQPGFNSETPGQGRYAVAWGTFTTTETVTSTVTSKLTAICLSTTNYQTCGSSG